MPANDAISDPRTVVAAAACAGGRSHRSALAGWALPAWGIVLSAVLFGAPARAADGHDAHHGHAAEAPAAAAQFAPSEGEVKRLDPAGKRVTIAHGPLDNLGMPPMTMAFEVEQAAVLDALKVGDRIRFIAGKEGRRYTAREIEVVR